MSAESLISAAQGYASSLVTAATGAMEAASSAASGVGYSIPSAPDVPLPDAPAQSLDVGIPTLTGIDLNLPGAPTASLTFQDIAAISLGTAPTFTASAPTSSLPSLPSQVAGFNTTAPSVSTLDFPDPPAALMNPLLDAPALGDRAEPVAPATELPAFEAQLPEDDTEPPKDLPGVLAGKYQAQASSMVTMANGFISARMALINPQYAEQMERIEVQLAKYLKGGTALASEVEDAIYSRARAKNDAEARRVRDSVYAEAAERGFTMPGGAQFSAAQQARQAASDNNTRASTDIAIAQAEMEQKNLQFAVTTSSNLRAVVLGSLMSYMQNLVSYNGQALEFGKTALNGVIETYNIAVRAFATKLDAYKAEAQVYDVKLRGAMAGIELYRAEVSALEALTQVDRSKVEVYKARIDSLTSLAGVYRAQIEAVQGRAGLERLKLDVFQSQVQAYAAQVQAKNAEWQGYSAAIEGQTAQARLFTSQAEAYSAQVQGYKATIDAQSEVVRATATTNDSRARTFTAQWSGYQTIVQSLGEVARTKLENQRQEITAFQAQVALATANAQVSAEYYRAVAGVAIENAKLRLSAQVQGAESQRAYGETLARLGTANAQTYAGMANAAMSGMNSLAAVTLVEG